MHRWIVFVIVAAIAVVTLNNPNTAAAEPAAKESEKKAPDGADSKKTKSVVCNGSLECRMRAKTALDEGQDEDISVLNKARRRLRRLGLSNREKAESAKQDAEEAKAEAEKANAKAGEAKQDAKQAKDDAAEAQSTANEAKKAAGEAQVEAQQANAKAGEAKQDAKQNADDIGAAVTVVNDHESRLSELEDDDDDYIDFFAGTGISHMSGFTSVNLNMRFDLYPDPMLPIGLSAEGFGGVVLAEGDNELGGTLFAAGYSVGPMSRWELPYDLVVYGGLRFHHSEIMEKFFSETSQRAMGVEISGTFRWQHLFVSLAVPIVHVENVVGEGVRPGVAISLGGVL